MMEALLEFFPPLGGLEPFEWAVLGSLTTLGTFLALTVRTWTAMIKTTRDYAGWAVDRFGYSYTIGSALWRIARWDSCVQVPWMPGFMPGFVSLRPGTSDLPVYDEVLRGSAYSVPMAVEPKVVVDAGAHIGLSVRWFAATFPNARLIALEPEPSNYKLAVRNTRACPRVTMLNAGLWSHAGALAIEDPKAATWSMRVKSAVSGIPSYGVADLMKEYGLTHIDLLKIDIEGAEVEVLSTAESWMHKVGTLVIELHDRTRPGCTAALEAAIAGAGFTSREVRNEVVILKR